ncbi:hypothetical protein BCR35DRAFT_313102 [Leucosporidium creatinivorum]|uniref:Uncharacterized protein n=1 Tax=Leucosporidium creatinivorum TaxID=106004 RepID=A0A1Y2FZQ2_9BASI|nr:hypothetical protein BCR35DRAFT_313102 [Leucosporidium creatinivorum]
MDSASAQAAILNLINNLPDGSNPYEAIRTYLWQQLVPSISESLPNQLYALSGALGVCLALVLISLGMRAYGRAFWIARIGTNGLWTPHWSISWSLFAVVLVACLEAQIWVTMSYLKRTQIVYSYLALRIFPWIAAWMGGWTALWSLAVSYLTHRNAMGKLPITTTRALLVNSLLVLFPVVYLAALLPFAIKSCSTYSSLLDIFASLDKQLQEGAATYDPSTFSIIALAPGLAGLTSLTSLMSTLIWDVRRVFIVFTVSGVVIVLILILVSFLHLQSLSQVIHETTSIMNTLESSASKESALLRSYVNLKWTSLSFISICLCFTAVCLYTSIDTAPALTNILVLQVDLLMPL